MGADRAVVIGAGVGGLVAALLLAARGLDVTVVERAHSPGGKLRELDVAGQQLDAGPTVFTMRHVFEQIFSDAGASLADHISLKQMDLLARHAWSKDERLDLFSNIERSADAIGVLAGASEARGYRSFCECARRIHDALIVSFIEATKPSVATLIKSSGLRGLGALWEVSPFVSLWRALGDHFRDRRLRQLFGRYATYCGSSPFLAPATLMMIAHVEREGVWLVEGGMYQIAEALARLAAARGAKFVYGDEIRQVIVRRGRIAGVRAANGEEIAADAIIANCDVAAIGAGLFGDDISDTAPMPMPRSLSAITWAMVAKADGFPLTRHNVFFSSDYGAEFDDIFQRSRVPEEPTVYVCAQDRSEDDNDPREAERLLCLINAPPNGDLSSFDNSEIESCAQRTFRVLEHRGLRIERNTEAMAVTTPASFNRLFPATGGALYGQPSHGWMASFRRPGCRTRVPGLYLAGGSTHPGPGVPMAALSGRLAAAALMADLDSTSRSRMMAMPGGTSIR
jgi:1-hydroxycarotenoid 3,4-desaturase